MNANPQAYPLPETKPNTAAPTEHAPRVGGADEKWQRISASDDDIGTLLAECEQLFSTSREAKQDPLWAHLRPRLLRAEARLMRLPDPFADDKFEWVQYYLGRPRPHVEPAGDPERDRDGVPGPVEPREDLPAVDLIAAYEAETARLEVLMKLSANTSGAGELAMKAILEILSRRPTVQ